MDTIAFLANTTNNLCLLSMLHVQDCNLFRVGMFYLFSKVSMQCIYGDLIICHNHGNINFPLQFLIGSMDDKNHPKK